MDYISRLPMEIYELFVLNTKQADRWILYNRLLNIPAFARTLTPGRILDFMEICGVNVHVRTIASFINKGVYKHLEWSLNGATHRIGGPALDHENGVRIYYIHGEPCSNCIQSGDVWYVHADITFALLTHLLTY